MISVNATEFKNNLGQYLQKIYAEPVVIHKMGRPTAVLLSYEAYLQLSQKEKSCKELSAKEQALASIKSEFNRVRAGGVGVNHGER